MSLYAASSVGISAGNKTWRNLVTGECRSSTPRFGELDWFELSSASDCAHELG